MYVCAAAPAGVIASVALSRRIPQAELRPSNETYVWLRGLCGGAAAHELFFTDSRNDMVRSFDARPVRLDAFRPAVGECVNDVAYSAELHSLFVATCESDDSGVSVRSFRRTESKWCVCHRVQLAADGNGDVFLRVLRDGTLFCGQSVKYRVIADRSIQHSARLTLSHKHRGFDAQLNGNERQLAAALQDHSGAIGLFRLEAESAVQLSIVYLPGARLPLFCGDTLLVAVANNGDNEVHEAVSFSTTGARLQRDRQLIARNGQLDIYRWCFADGTIYAFDCKSKDLLVFNCIYA